jgi:membrane-bound lytic murein transglycosylase D
LKKNHILVSLIFSLFIISGCGQPTYHTGGLQNTPAVLASATTPKTDQPSQTQPPPINSQPSDALGSGDETNISQTDAYAAPRNDKPENAVPGATPPTPESILDEALDFCQLSQDFWQEGELESAIEALDQAYALALTVDTAASPKHIRQKEDLRFMISKRILEIYASRNIVVNGNHNEIPRTLNKHVQAEINLFTGNEKKFFLESYKRSGLYRDRILSKLKAAGLPEELAWLPLIESGFKVKALSKARALGLWQFIPSTGYKFGLNRNKYIDERLDPEKATRAAIDYLSQLHQMFGDWATVLAAYNCGEGRVLKVIRGQNVNYLDNFWDLYERLPRETARYVPRFLATLHIIGNPEKYGMTMPEPYPALSWETITVSKQIHLKNAAGKLGLSEQKLKDLNPELRYSILPGEKYTLRVPPGKGQNLLAVIDEIPVSRPPSPAYTYHRVRSGETLSTIAKRYKTSVRKIMRANNLRKSNYIVAGRKLKIPLRGYVGYQPPSQKTTYAGKASTYKVKSGDSLWIIAKRFGTTTKKIQTANNLSTTRLRIGQILKIPGSSATASGSKQTYVVQSGDSPYLIAKKHKMPLSRFLSLNRLTPRCKIFPGQQLYVD